MKNLFADSILDIQSSFLPEFGKPITEMKMNPTTFIEVVTHLVHATSSQYINLKTRTMSMQGIRLTSEPSINPGWVQEYSGKEFIGAFKLEDGNIHVD